MSTRQELDTLSRPYLNERLIVDRGEYCVIYSPEFRSVEFACPVCSSIVRTLEDELEMKKHKCCQTCANQWAYPRAKEWHEGWRPSLAEVQSMPLKQLVFSFDVD
jgi:hypothetical protein